MALVDDFKARFPEFDETVADERVPVLDLVWPSYYGGTYPADQEIILNLVAHLLVQDQAAGVAGKKSVSGHSVGSVSESFAAPTETGSNMQDFFITTKYGKQFLYLTSNRRGGAFV